jgi:hypothetical protein
MTQESAQHNFEPEKHQLADSPCQQAMGERRAEHQAAFLLPYLHPGMKLHQAERLFLCCEFDPMCRVRLVNSVSTP